ncbi:hypothetical protein SAMN05216464_110180 [Mucilaginibacter pineti]|uniref:Uncharacterized protein n=1 Tax=Mucilaginibacter pineti TaxID=1391627 RepID=A0A1G7GK13_9SPHI|nr:hypothetical protein [Mucilaginibacter pineti]SDE88444.1 hypothetical protein SAMN05216464_110180 [Mucilaginibacter pineti]
MKFFRSRKEDTTSGVGDKAAGWIASGILKLQRNWVKGMEKLFSKLSPASTKVVLVIAFLFAAGYCTMMVAYSFGKTATVMLKQVNGVQPVAIGKTVPDLPPGVPAFIKRMERFKHYLDSLSKTGDGRKIRDSLLFRRPGLLDSIQRIERIYCEK